MQRLRTASLLVRLVLAWFALSLGVAVAAPLVQPSSMELVCSGGGMKLLVKDAGGQPAADEGAGSVASHTLDCPLCASLDAPPVPSVAGTVPAPLGHALHPIVAARLAALTAAPPPARGPPPRLSI